MGVGTAPLGGLYEAVSEDSAAEVFELALARGIRFFDTAPQYGHGLAEMRLGRGLQGFPRDEVVVATKVGRLLREGAPLDKRYYHGTPSANPIFDFTYDGIMRSVEESLERLNLDRIDILHIHDPDEHYEEALGQAFAALRKLRSEGSIGAIGAGMNQAEMLTQFAHERDFDCFLLAGRYTLLEQDSLDNLLPTCLARRIGVFAGGVYNSGLLADPRPGAHFNYEEAPAALIERALELKAVCESHGIPLKAAAIQFPSFHPAVTSVLTGARSADELRENLDLFSTRVPIGVWTELKSRGFVRQDAPTPSA